MCISRREIFRELKRHYSGEISSSLVSEIQNELKSMLTCICEEIVDRFNYINSERRCINLPEYKRLTNADFDIKKLFKPGMHANSGNVGKPLSRDNYISTDAKEISYA